MSKGKQVKRHPKNFGPGRVVATGAAGGVVVILLRAVNVVNGAGLEDFIAVGVIIGFIALCFWLATKSLPERIDPYKADYLDAEAQEIYERIKENLPTKPFTLYLRPFKVTDSMPVKIDLDPTGRSATPQRKTESLEKILPGCLEYRPLLCVGKGIAHSLWFGNIMIKESGREWINEFKLIAERASCVIMVPGPSDGALEEIKWLKKARLLGKCLFVQPNELSGRSAEEFWNEARAAVSPCGVDLPPFVPDIRIFVLNDDGVCYKEPSSLGDVLETDLLTDVLRELQLSQSAGTLSTTLPESGPIPEA